MLDILINNAILITMEGKGLGIIEDGSLGIKGDRIEAIGKTAEIARTHKAHREIDASGKVVMPGLIDAHFHSAIAILRGVAQDVTNWLQEGIWPFIKIMDREESVKGSLVNIIEGIKAGTTTFADFDYFMNDIVENHIKLGTRAQVAETVNEIHDKIDQFVYGDLYDFNPSVGQEKLNDNIRLIEKYHNSHNGRITCMLGPQAPDMISKELLLEIKNLSRKYGVMIHLHVAQGQREVDQMTRRYNRRSVEFLDEIGYLDDRLQTVHLSSATRDEIALVAQRGCSLAVCYGSICLGGVVPPLSDFLEHSGRVGLGSDNAPGNNCNNIFNEMKLASLMNKVKAKNGTVMPAWQVMRVATVGAARALGLEEEIGSLKVGKKADVIVIDLETPNLTPVYTKPVRNIVPNLVYAANGGEVETSIIDGRIVMEGRKILTCDERQAVAEAQKAADGLAKRLVAAGVKIHPLTAQRMKDGVL